MDTLLLISSFAIIFEVKNVGGRLKFIDNPPQLIRIRADGHIDGFDSPAAQVERNVELFNKWLQIRGIHLPVYGVVVLAYLKQIVEQAPAKTKVLFPNLIPPYIRSLTPSSVWLEKDKLNWLTTEILNNHQRYIPSPLCEVYNIQKREIRTGVRCESCGVLGMTKSKKGWYCINCSKISKDAHQQAIKEWFLLFGDKMTNKDCREFLYIEKMQTTTRILQSMNLKNDGTFQNRTYTMIFDPKMSE
ncbi:nuclease-related domain-containing protein [Bacillus sp. FSL K6-3431]|uniref:nuclease-related domain-containing protein n=1 Tax=Bacillus sp. FSL K6-3431 TaxID=2921500 RepID=UPI0030F557A6